MAIEGFKGRSIPEFDTLRENIDNWIKTIRREFSEFSDIRPIVNDLSDLIQADYELILQLKDKNDELKKEIEDLKLEINAMKLIIIIEHKQKEKNERIT